jgi:sugar O-acyltransferase (sialic acid O-acetyltransferase NeuD family)
MDLVIVGTGGHAREVADVVRSAIADGAPYILRGFLESDPARHGRLVEELEVLGDESVLSRFRKCAVAVGIGGTALRHRVVRRLSEYDVEFPAFIHPSSTLTGRVEIGEGCMLMGGTVVTTNVRLLAHTHLNTASSASHDCVLGPFVHLAPGARVAGNVTLAEGVDVGIGASIVQGISIGAWSIVGAGAVVIADAPGNATLVGVPARITKTRAAGWHTS